jgi:uncharacterized repeat protein (TIGR03803 family)
MHRVRMWFALGLTLLPLALILILPAGAWAASQEKVVHSFTGGNDGSTPIGNLVLDKSGNLYGVAGGGGKSKNGVVYKLTPTSGGRWAETVVYSFNGGTDGASPVGGVVFDKAGNLFGVTSGGGNGCSNGCGTVFELIPGGHGKWTEVVLYTFTGGSDGGSPDTILILDKAGNLYGTTQAGGDASCAPGGCGTVFKLTRLQGGHWKETVLHAFRGGQDGASPFLAGVILSAAGNLYGTTTLGGNYDKGTVFELAPAKGGRWTETILHAFKGGRDGASPAAGLALFKGTLYGTTYAGGEQCVFRGGLSAGCGTVFQLKPAARGKWTESVIHRFHGSDGIETFATPVLDQAGNLYGTTFEGGSGNCGVCGTAFELTPTANGHWKETVLHNFGSRRGDAGTPEGGLILDKTGKLFGTTVLGGNANVGAVYQIIP